MKARVVTILGLAIFIGYLLVVAAIHAEGRRSAEAGDTPLFTDFTSLYAAALLAREGQPADLYRPRLMYQASLAAAQAAYGGKLSEKQARAIGFHPWMYPPSFILLALPLALLPYFAAWGTWLAVTAVPYLAAMRAILRDRSFWLVALGAPPVFYNLMYGQTGFLTAGLIGLGLAWLHPRPWLAGLCIGLASVKPHFGILIPVALVCGGHWRAFGAAAATVLATVAASVALLGPDAWYGFLGTGAANLQGFGQGAKWEVIPTVYAALRQAGLSAGAAGWGQAVVGALAAAAVGRAWWWRPDKPARPGLEAALLCTATLLAVPMAYFYDLVLLVPAIGWLWADLRDRGQRRWELGLLAACGAGLAALWPLADVLGSFPGLVIIAALFGLCLGRLGGGGGGAVRGCRRSHQPSPAVPES